MPGDIYHEESALETPKSQMTVRQSQEGKIWKKQIEPGIGQERHGAEREASVSDAECGSDALNKVC